MLESLNCPPAQLPNWTLLLFAALGGLFLSIPFYQLLKPLYLQIDGLRFLPLFALLVGLAFLGLELFNRNYLAKVLAKIDTDSFLFNLRPYEMVYLKTQKLLKVVNGVLNELVEKNRLLIGSDNQVQKLAGPSEGFSPEQQQVLLLLEENGPMSYPDLVKQLLNKPVFKIKQKTLSSVLQYVLQSKPFGFLLLINCSMYGMVFSWGIVRLVLGFQRDKPVLWLVLVLAIYAIAAIYFIIRSRRLLFEHILPDFYRYQIVPLQPAAYNWQWRYFMFEHLVLAPALVLPMRKHEAEQAMIASGGAYTGGESSSGGDGGGGDGGGSCGGGCGGCGS